MTYCSKCSSEIKGDCIPIGLTDNGIQAFCSECLEKEPKPMAAPKNYAHIPIGSKITACNDNGSKTDYYVADCLPEPIGKMKKAWVRLAKKLS